jgi:hypothetical protein
MNLTSAAFRIHCRYQIVVKIGTVEQNYTNVRSERFLLNVLKCLQDRTASISAHTELKNQAREIWISESNQMLVS